MFLFKLTIISEKMIALLHKLNKFYTKLCYLRKIKRDKL